MRLGETNLASILSWGNEKWPRSSQSQKWPISLEKIVYEQVGFEGCTLLEFSMSGQALRDVCGTVFWRVVKCRESVVKDFRRSGRLKVRKKCREPRREKCRESVAKGALKVSRKPQVSQKCRESALKVSRKRSCKLETQTKRTSVAKSVAKTKVSRKCRDKCREKRRKCRESVAKKKWSRHFHDTLRHFTTFFTTFHDFHDLRLNPKL